MKVNTFHNGDLIERSNWITGTTPSGVVNWYKRHSAAAKGEVMIGAVIYYIKNVTYANNDTEISVKVSTKFQEKEWRKNENRENNSTYFMR